MKKFICASVGAAVIAMSVAPAIAGAEYPTANGTWILVDRVCQSGKKPTDAFQLGRDRLKLTISFWDAEAQGSIEGQPEFAVRADVDQLIQRIAWYRFEKSWNGIAPGMADYRLQSNDRLDVYTGDFGPGGSCSPNDVLISTFSKQK